MSPTREKYPLSRRKIFKKTLSNSIGIVFFIVIVGAVFSVTFLGATDEMLQSLFFPVVIGSVTLPFILVIGMYLYQKWYFATYFYDLTPHFIQIKKGPITPMEITLPYERIQDVYVDQDLLDRILGLYDVHLSSATYSSGQIAHIDGLEKAAADGLREALLHTVQDRISKNRMTSSSQSSPTV